MLQNRQTSPYDYFSDGPETTGWFDSRVDSLSMSDMDFIAAETDDLGGDYSSWLSEVDFVAGTLDDPYDATVDAMGYGDPFDEYLEEPVMSVGLQVQTGDIKLPSFSRRKKKDTGDWYEKAPGQTAKKQLPDGVVYQEDSGLYRWTHYTRDGRAVERVATTPPTPKQLRRSRNNFNRSRGILGTGIGASSQPLDVKDRPASQPEHYVGDTRVHKTWDGRTQPPQPPYQDGENIPPLLPYQFNNPMKMGPPNQQPRQSNNGTPKPAPSPTSPNVIESAGQQPVTPPTNPQAQQPVKQADMGVKGSRTTAPGITRPDDEYEFNWRVMELGEVTPSHDSATMEPRADYASGELQPRDRERASSERQVAKIARELRPGEVLDDTHMLDMGPPIVGPDGAVESGSGRVMGIQRAAVAHPDRYKAYVDELKKQETLERVGMKPEDIAQINQPILVRERATQMDTAQRQAFAREANEPRAMASSTSEVAMDHARSFNDQELARLDIPNSASPSEVLLSEANRDIANRFIGSFSENQVAQLADDKGNLNKQGLDAMRASLFSRVYGNVRGGKQLTQELQENVDEDMQRIGQALQTSLPAVAKSAALVRSGQRKPQYSIAEDVAVAVQTLRSLKRRKMPVENYLRSYTIDNAGLTPTQKRLLVFFDRHSNSPRVMSDFLRDYATFVISQPDMNQGSMMGPAPESKAAFIQKRVPLPSEQQAAVNKDMSFRARDDVSPEVLAAGKLGKQRRQGIR